MVVVDSEQNRPVLWVGGKADRIFDQSAFGNRSSRSADSGFVNAAGAASAAPVQSVNGQTGAVSLTIPTTAADVGAMDSSDYTTETWTFTLFDNTTVTKKVVVEA